MNPAILRKLRAADSEEAEYPPGFNWRSETERVEALVWRLEAILGLMLKVDDSFQDASCYSEIYHQHLVRGRGEWHTSIAFRFSNFGRLFTHWSNSTLNRPKRRYIQEAVAYIESEGFVFVGGVSLKQKYDGLAESLHGYSWHNRFFDWL